MGQARPLLERAVAAATPAGVGIGSRAAPGVHREGVEQEAAWVQEQQGGQSRLGETALARLAQLKGLQQQGLALAKQLGAQAQC